MRLRLQFLLFLGVVSLSAAGNPPLAIVNVTVIDTVRGERAGPRTVLIAAIGEPRAVRIPPKAVQIDGHGLYLTPGLVDMHVHLFNNSSRRPPNEWAFPLFVANGVTSVREMRTEPAQIAKVRAWRAKVARGELVAPRVLAAGVAAQGKTEDEARRQVRAAHAAGADFIKIFSEVPERQWRAILAQAGKLGMPVCGHVPAEVSLLTAARAGQRSNEHLTQVYEASAAKEAELLAPRQGLASDALLELRDAQESETLASFDPRLCARVAAALAQTGQVQVPTLVLPHAEANPARARFRDDPRWGDLGADERRRWEKFLEGAPAAGPALSAKRWEVSRRIVRALHAAKVPILAGTDTPMPLVYPGSSLHDELALLVACGMTPAEALRAATPAPAELLGLTKSSGSVAPGKQADLLLLEADPLQRIDNLRRIRAVVLGGRLLQRADLDALLYTTGKL